MNIKIFRIIFVLLLIVITVGCLESSIKNDGIYTVINTNKGKIVCKLFFKKTPVTVGNFIQLAEGTKEYIDAHTKEKIKKPFYDRLTFHRVVKGFVIQSGCPLGNGLGGPGYQFVDEFDNTLTHDAAGILSMANSGPNTNGSQFFITLDKAVDLDGFHTVFGKVISGLDVVLDIGKVAVDENDKPLEDVIINDIKIIRKGNEAKEFDAAEAFALNEQKLKDYNDAQEKMKKDFYIKLGIDDTKLIKTEIGYKYLIKKIGKGKKPKKKDIIVANYTGYLENGTKLVSSDDNGEKLKVPIGIGGIIPGLDDAFLNMREGGKRIVVLPYFLAYGEYGQAPLVPPKATIIFDIELIEVINQ
jgi:peptidylprolyl isomerase